jgi:hypothetical protein
MTLARLVCGTAARQREAEIAAAIALLPVDESVACILEGLADANSPLQHLTDDPQHRLNRIAPGCPCCVGNLVMRVTLNRLLRAAPHHLFVSIANSAHREQMRDFLRNPPYDDYLILQDDLIAP